MNHNCEGRENTADFRREVAILQGLIFIPLLGVFTPIDSGTPHVQAPGLYISASLARWHPYKYTGEHLLTKSFINKPCYAEDTPLHAYT